MDPDMMYDEFGNYIGPELESEDENESEEEEEDYYQDQEDTVEPIGKCIFVTAPLFHFIIQYSSSYLVETIAYFI